MGTRLLVRHRRLKARAGFTLIELLVVVVIIGILASVAMPSFGRAQDMARNAAMKSHVRNVQLALETYGSDNHSRYPANLLDTTFLTAPYMPSGALPRAPWNRQPQSGTGGAVSEAAVVTNWEGIKNWAMNPANAGTFSGIDGQVVASPTTSSHYGMLLYAYDNTENVYRMVGIGKYNKNIFGINPVTNGN